MNERQKELSKHKKNTKNYKTNQVSTTQMKLPPVSPTISEFSTFEKNDKTEEDHISDEVVLDIPHVNISIMKKVCKLCYIHVIILLSFIAIWIIVGTLNGILHEVQQIYIKLLTLDANDTT